MAKGDRARGSSNDCCELFKGAATLNPPRRRDRDFDGRGLEVELSGESGSPLGVSGEYGEDDRNGKVEIGLRGESGSAMATEPDS